MAKAAKAGKVVYGVSFEVPTDPKYLSLKDLEREMKGLLRDYASFKVKALAVYFVKSVIMDSMGDPHVGR